MIHVVVHQTSTGAEHLPQEVVDRLVSTTSETSISGVRVVASFLSSAEMHKHYKIGAKLPPSSFIEMVCFYRLWLQLHNLAGIERVAMESDWT